MFYNTKSDITCSFECLFIWVFVSDWNWPHLTYTYRMHTEVKWIFDMAMWILCYLLNMAKWPAVDKVIVSDSVLKYAIVLCFKIYRIFCLFNKSHWTLKPGKNDEIKMLYNKMGLDARKPHIVACEQQRRRPTWPSAHVNCYMPPIRDILWLAETSFQWLRPILMSTSDELNLAQDRSTSGFVSAEQTAKIDWTKFSPG